MSSTARTSRCRRRTRLFIDARSPASRSGTRNVLFSSAAAPDFGVLLQGLERELAARGHELERVVLDRRGGGKLRHARLALRAVRAARRFRPDVVYVHFLFPAGFSGLLAARASGAPLV